MLISPDEVEQWLQGSWSRTRRNAEAGADDAVVMLPPENKVA